VELKKAASEDEEFTDENVLGWLEKEINGFWRFCLVVCDYWHGLPSGAEAVWKGLQRMRDLAWG